MQQTKLIVLWQTLNSEEMKRLGDYLKSPYFNKREAPIALYKILAAHYPDFDNLKWDKLFKKAFPDKPAYNDVYLRNVLSDLYALTEGFLTQEHRLLVPIRNETDLCYQFVMRDLFTIAEKKLAVLDADLSKRQQYDDYYYDWRVWYDRLADWTYYRQAKSSQRAPALQQKADNLFCHFWIYILRLYGVMLNAQDLFDSYTYDMRRIEAVLPLFDPAFYADNPMLLSEYYTSMLLRPQATDADFELTYGFIQNYRAQLPNMSIVRLNTHLSNYLKWQEKTDIVSNELRLQLSLDSLELYKTEKQNLPVYTYNTITDVGYAVKGAVWVRRFIAEHSDQLPQELREGWRTFAEARIALYEGKPHETIHLLASYPDFYERDYFYVKFYLLFAYYDTQNYDAFDLLADTISHTLRNQKEKLPKREYFQFKNTLSLLQKLNRLHLQFNPAQFEETRQWLGHTLGFYGKGWLLHAVGQLEAYGEKNAKLFSVK